jgi:hemerythrin-like metal-binding protein
MPSRRSGIQRASVSLAGSSVGLMALDLDHHLLQISLGILENEISYPERGETLGKAIEFLVHLSDAHFMREERLMSEIGFPGFESHKSNHDIMRAWMDASLPELGAMRNPHYDDDVVSYLYDWWDGHTAKEDKAYAEFIQHRLDEARRIVDSLPRVSLPSFLASAPFSTL